MANAQAIPSQSNWSNGLDMTPANAALLAQGPTQLYVVDTSGAIPVQGGVVIITKGTAAVMTLAAPTAGADDGKIIRIMSTTAAAHTVTNTTPGFNAGGSASDVATFGAAIGNNMNVIAYNGNWYVFAQVGVTLG